MRSDYCESVTVCACLFACVIAVRECLFEGVGTSKVATCAVTVVVAAIFSHTIETTDPLYRWTMPPLGWQWQGSPHPLHTMVDRS